MSQAEGRGCLQAHAWTALGKLCLADEGLAKKCVHLFVQQLDRASSPAVRCRPCRLTCSAGWLACSATRSLLCCEADP